MRSGIAGWPPELFSRFHSSTIAKKQSIFTLLVPIDRHVASKHLNVRRGQTDLAGFVQHLFAVLSFAQE